MFIVTCLEKKENISQNRSRIKVNSQIKFQIRISGIKEADEKLNYIERQTYQRNCLNKIIEHTNNKQVQMTDFFRLGKFVKNSTRPRTMLVTPSSAPICK